ncbi:hypothetical protein [Nocardia sp. NPDC003979]
MARMAKGGEKNFSGGGNESPQLSVVQINDVERMSLKFGLTPGGADRQD